MKFLSPGHSPNRPAGGWSAILRINVAVCLSLVAACLCTSPAQAERLFVAESGTAIVTYDVSLANATLVAASRTTFATVANDYQIFNGLAFDQSGNLYASKHTTILKFDSSGTLVSTFSSPNSNSGLMGLALDTSGNLYAAAFWDNLVLKFDSNGDVVSSITPNSDYPTDVAFDSLGNLYVVSRNYNVEKYDSSGTYLGIFGFNYGNPYGIAFDSAENAYVSVAQTPGRVVKFDFSGTLVSQIYSNMNYPTGLAVDSLDNVYVNNAGAGKISKYDSTGEFLFEWSVPSAGMFFAFQPVSVPEPSTWAMALAGLACGGFSMWRRRKRA